MAVHLLAQVTLPYNTALPADVAVNNWSFDVADDTEPNYEQVGNFLQSFYEDIATYLSPVLDLSGARFKLYRRADAEPRSPVADTEVDLGDANTGGLFPEEVACCLSFRGVLESGTPPARRRGRIYVGPVSDRTIVTSDAQGRSLIAASVRSDMLDAYEAAWDALTTAGNVHEVWSPTDGEGHPVVQAWMDDAYDTQRRRGPAATTRTVRSAPFEGPI